MRKRSKSQELKGILKASTGRQIHKDLKDNADDQFLKDLKALKVNIDLTKYDKSTATYCAILSNMAYWEKNKIDQLVGDSNLEITYKLIEYSSKTNRIQALLWCSCNLPQK